MGNDITWWKDRDTWMPSGGNEPTLDGEADLQNELPIEDIGDVAHDESEDLDDDRVKDRDAKD